MGKYEINLLKLAKHCGAEYIKKGCDGFLLSFYDSKDSELGCIVLRNKQSNFSELELLKQYNIDELLGDN